MSKAFGKFIQQKETGAKLKESIRQEKKAVRKETQAFFSAKKQEAKKQREQYREQRAASGEQPYGNKRGGKKGGRGNEGGSGYEGGQRSEGSKPRSGGNGKEYNRFSYQQRMQKRSNKEQAHEEELANKPSKEDSNKTTFKRAYTTFSDKKKRGEDGQGDAVSATKPVKQYQAGGEKKAASRGVKHTDSKPAFSSSRKTASPVGHKPASGGYDKSAGVSKSTGPVKAAYAGKSAPAKEGKPASDASKTASAKPVVAKQGGAKVPREVNVLPLNKYLSHSGVSSRREAADIVKSGKVLVNGKVVTEPGFKVNDKDVVKVNGKEIQIRRTMVYILLNKPKDFITTTEDPEGRKTVLDIIKNATTERVYPIGRLDRNTTGVLLLTNDGELTQKLSHPSYQVKKIYEVKLDKPLAKKDFDAILAGITLEDGFVAPDVLAYADSKDKSVIGIEIHSGRNRIVRRIFEHLGYDVRNLDRVMYANLTKKNVDRGKWRFLSEKEVRLLKFLNSSYTNKSKTSARG